MSFAYNDGESVSDFSEPLHQKIQTHESLDYFSPRDGQNWNGRRLKTDDIRDLAMQIVAKFPSYVEFQSYQMQQVWWEFTLNKVYDLFGNLVSIDFDNPVEFPYSKLREMPNFVSRMKRMTNCSGWLKFTKSQTPMGDIKVRLKDARFCRVRECPVCQWRRSLTWYYRFFKNLSVLREKYSNHSFLHLTLTVENCHISNLRETLQAMGQAWIKMTDLKKTGCVFKEFKIVKGYVKSIEVTREKKRTDYAHPHFHCLLLVPTSYFSSVGYIKHEKWLTAWKTAVGCSRISQVSIQRVFAKKSVVELTDDLNDGIEMDMYSVLPEIVKYATKSDEFFLPEVDKDLLSDAVRPYCQLDNVDWYAEYVRQVHRLRFISMSGALKKILEGADGSDAENVSNEEMILRTEEPIDEIELMQSVFHWSGQGYFKKDYEE